MRKSVLFNLFLLICLSITPVAAQIRTQDKLVSEYLKLKGILKPKTEKVDNRCELFGNADFYGSLVTFNLNNVDIRMALEQITKQAGVKFVIDQSIEPSNLTSTVGDLPWTIALNTVLRTQGLTATVKCPVISISKTADSNGREIETKNNFPERILPDIPSLYSEFVRFKNLRLKTNISDGKPEIMAGNNVDFNENTLKFLKISAKLLSRRGSVEVDERSSTIIISDEESRVKLISNFVKMMDDSGLHLEEITNEPGFVQ